jgi:hypothetical protein
MMPIMRDLNARRDELDARTDFIKLAGMVMIDRTKREAAAMAKAVNLSPRVQEILTKQLSPRRLRALASITSADYFLSCIRTA